MLVNVSVLDFGDLSAGGIDFTKMRSLFRNDSGILREHVHRELIQIYHVLRVCFVLHLPFVVDICQEVAIFEIFLQILRVSKVLGRHQSALHQSTPCVSLE